MISSDSDFNQKYQLIISIKFQHWKWNEQTVLSICRTKKRKVSCSQTGSILSESNLNHHISIDRNLSNTISLRSLFCSLLLTLIGTCVLTNCCHRQKKRRMSPFRWRIDWTFQNVWWNSERKRVKTERTIGPFPIIYLPYFHFPTFIML